jgi:hypothetical protein
MSRLSGLILLVFAALALPARAASIDDFYMFCYSPKAPDSCTCGGIKVTPAPLMTMAGSGLPEYFNSLCRAGVMNEKLGFASRAEFTSMGKHGKAYAEGRIKEAHAACSCPAQLVKDIQGHFPIVLSDAPSNSASIERCMKSTAGCKGDYNVECVVRDVACANYEFGVDSMAPFAKSSCENLFQACTTTRLKDKGLSVKNRTLKQRDSAINYCKPVMEMCRSAVMDIPFLKTFSLQERITEIMVILGQYDVNKRNSRKNTSHGVRN